ncbi:unnamed protein product, partial [Effrenium voratum]
EAASEETDGFKDRKEALEAVLSAVQRKYSSRSFDDGDKIVLRAFMRRYGWERRLQPAAQLKWMQTFSESQKADDYDSFAWFLLSDLLHPCAAASTPELHCPLAVAAERTSLAGCKQEHLALHQDILAWQDVEGKSCLPTHEQSPHLAKRVDTSCNSGALRRARTLRKAYPPDFTALRVWALDCWSADDEDVLGGVAWRSPAERALFFNISVSQDGESGDHQVPFVPRLEQVAAKLDCGPSMPAVAEKMARSLLWAFPDESEAIEHKFCCRLCGESRPTLWDLQEHIALLHLHGGGDQDRAFVEYRKKVLALAELAGPQ